MPLVELGQYEWPAPSGLVRPTPRRVSLGGCPSPSPSSACTSFLPPHAYLEPAPPHPSLLEKLTRATMSTNDVDTSAEMAFGTGAGLAGFGTGLGGDYTTRAGLGAGVGAGGRPTKGPWPPGPALGAGLCPVPPHGLQGPCTVLDPQPSTLPGPCLVPRAEGNGGGGGPKAPGTTADRWRLLHGGGASVDNVPGDGGDNPGGGYGSGYSSRSSSVGNGFGTLRDVFSSAPWGGARFVVARAGAGGFPGTGTGTGSGGWCGGEGDDENPIAAASRRSSAPPEDALLDDNPGRVSAVEVGVGDQSVVHVVHLCDLDIEDLDACRKGRRSAGSFGPAAGGFGSVPDAICIHIG